MASAAVTVHVRARPLNPKEAANPDVRNIVRCIGSQVSVDAAVARETSRRMASFGTATRDRSTFAYSHVHTHRSTQDDVFNTTVLPSIAGAFDGINGAVLAYGATGSGKTHTMMGSPSSTPGVIPQAGVWLYDRKAELESIGKVVTFKWTYYEVYMEEVIDLAKRQRKPLTVRDNGDSAPCDIKGITTHTCADVDEFLAFIDRCNTNRKSAPTFQNELSSRSHAILSLDVDVKDTRDASTGRSARVKFCDLAGSERAAASQNTGARHAEGAKINQSLLALGGVIKALATKSKHISYRQSKLTRLLKECLGGNCICTMIVCVSPASTAVEETMNSLHYATYAQQIEVAIKKNEFREDTEQALAEALEAIDQLKRENAELKARSQPVSSSAAAGDAPATTSAAYNAAIQRDQATDCDDFMPALDAPPFTPGASNSALHDRGGMSPMAHGGTGRLRDLSPDDKAAHEAYESQLEALCDEQMSLMSQLGRELGLAEELRCDEQIRNAKMTIINHLASNSGSSGNPNAPPPVAVAGAQNLVATANEAKERRMAQRLALEEELNTLGKRLDALKSEVIAHVKGGHRALLLDAWDKHALRSNAVEAETLATTYCQRAFVEELRNKEYGVAAEKLVDVVRRLAIAAGSNVDDELRRDMSLAVAYSVLPACSTDDLVDTFRARTVATTSRLDLSGVGARSPASSMRHSVRLDLLSNPKSTRRPSHSASAPHTPPTFSPVDRSPSTPTIPFSPVGDSPGLTPVALPTGASPGPAGQGGLDLAIAGTRVGNTRAPTATIRTRGNSAGVRAGGKGPATVPVGAPAADTAAASSSGAPERKTTEAFKDPNKAGITPPSKQTTLARSQTATGFMGPPMRRTPFVAGAAAVGDPRCASPSSLYAPKPVFQRTLTSATAATMNPTRGKENNSH